MNDGEGEGMRDIGVDVEFEGARNDGGSAKTWYKDCAV